MRHYVSNPHTHADDGICVVGCATSMLRTAAQHSTARLAAYTHVDSQCNDVNARCEQRDRSISGHYYTAESGVSDSGFPAAMDGKVSGHAADRPVMPS
jgi:hypothetical protein